MMMPLKTAITFNTHFIVSILQTSQVIKIKTFSANSDLHPSSKLPLRSENKLFFKSLLDLNCKTFLYFGCISVVLQEITQRPESEFQLKQISTKVKVHKFLLLILNSVTTYFVLSSSINLSILIFGLPFSSFIVCSAGG